MVVWSGYLTAIANAFGTSATEAGIIFSLTFTILAIIVVVIGTNGEKPEVTVGFTSFFSTLVFTFMGWYPIWTGSVISLVLAILLANVFSGSGSGKKE
jgi:hypothetical protein